MVATRTGAETQPPARDNTAVNTPIPDTVSPGTHSSEEIVFTPGDPNAPLLLDFSESTSPTPTRLTSFHRLLSIIGVPHDNDTFLALRNNEVLNADDLLTTMNDTTMYRFYKQLCKTNQHDDAAHTLMFEDIAYNISTKVEAFRLFLFDEEKVIQHTDGTASLPNTVAEMDTVQLDVFLYQEHCQLYIQNTMDELDGYIARDLQNNMSSGQSLPKVTIPVERAHDPEVLDSLKFLL